MDLTMFLLSLSHARTNVVMFILAGALAYFVDYRRMRFKPTHRRESILLKISSWVYVVGGTAVLCLFQIVSWFA